MKFCVLISFLFVITNAFAAKISIKKIAKLPMALHETSGIELYKNKYILSHNDSGNKPELFVFDLNGELIKRIHITNAKNIDWEDMTLDDEGNVYISDTGNNLNKRKSVFIYKINGEIIESTEREVEAETIEIQYADQSKFPPKEAELNYDSESILWKDDSLFLFTKCRTVPFTGYSYVYGFPAKAGNYSPKPKGPIKFCNDGWRKCSVTSVDYDPKSKTVAALLYGGIVIIQDFKGSDFWEGHMTSFSIAGIKQREALCFGGRNILYMTDEYRKPIGGGNLYRITIK